MFLWSWAEVKAIGNVFGNFFRVATYGESHGGGVGCTISGCPPRLPISEADMQVELDRRSCSSLMEYGFLFFCLDFFISCLWMFIFRRPGQSRITTPRKETDTCKILSGVADGLFMSMFFCVVFCLCFALSVVAIEALFCCSSCVWSVFSVSGMTTGTPIHVFVPNTDQRGHVSIQGSSVTICNCVNLHGLNYTMLHYDY